MLWKKGGNIWIWYLGLALSPDQWKHFHECPSVDMPMESCSRRISASSLPCRIAGGFCEAILNILIASNALHPEKTSVLKLLSLQGHVHISEMLETFREYSFPPMLPWHLLADRFPLTSSCPCLPARLGPRWTTVGQFGKNNTASPCRFAALGVRMI